MEEQIEMQNRLEIPPVPADTARTAKAVYSLSNIYLCAGDRLDVLLEGLNFNSSSLMKARYQLGSPLLALVTFFQYLEKLSDRQAAEASNTRIDWKYALHLSMNYLGVKPAALCEFRQGLLRQPDERQEFQKLLQRFWEGTCEAGPQGQPADAMRVLAELCARSRLDRVMTSMRNTLQALAIRNPEWLRNTSLPHWYSRYDMASRELDLAGGIDQQNALTEATGADILYLLEAIHQPNLPELAALNEVQELDRVRYELFECVSGDLLWGKNSCASCFYNDVLPNLNA